MVNIRSVYLECFFAMSIIQHNSNSQLCGQF